MRFARAARDRREHAARIALEHLLDGLLGQIKAIGPLRHDLPEQARKDLDWLERRAEKIERQLHGGQRAA